MVEISFCILSTFAGKCMDDILEILQICRQDNQSLILSHCLSHYYLHVLQLVQDFFREINCTYFYY